MLPLALDKVQNVGVEAAPCGLGILHQLLVRGVIHPEVYRFHAGEDMDSPAVVPNVKFWSPCWMVPKWDYICRVINEQRNATYHPGSMNNQTQTTAAMRSTSTSTFTKGEIVENFFTVNGRESVIVCKVIETLADGHVRVADLRDCGFGVTSHALIQSNKTWGAPASNLRVHDVDCKFCHKDGLVIIG